MHIELDSDQKYILTTNGGIIKYDDGNVCEDFSLQLGNIVISTFTLEDIITLGTNIINHATTNGARFDFEETQDGPMLYKK
jgi:hypothetical protein